MVVLEEVFLCDIILLIIIIWLYADLVEDRRKYFVEKKKIRNGNTEEMFDFLGEIGVFYQIRGVL